MSEMKHTPGPWEVNPSLSGSFVIESMAGWVLCQRASWEGNSEESRANGYLMAAAPELLEALRVLLAMHQPHHNSIEHSAARAAIAKAEGRS